MKLPPALQAQLERRLAIAESGIIDEAEWTRVEDRFAEGAKKVEVRIPAGGVTWLVMIRRSGKQFMCCVDRPLLISISYMSLENMKVELEWHFGEQGPRLTEWVNAWKEENRTGSERDSDDDRSNPASRRYRGIQRRNKKPRPSGRKRN